VLSLDPFLDADTSIDKDDFYPLVMETFEAQGLTWGLPGMVIINLIEFNKDLFDAAGIDYPATGWTMDEFLEIAVAMTEGEGDSKQYGYMSELFEPSDMLTIVDRLGADLVNDSADPPALNFLDPDTVEAIRWYVGLTTEHGVKPILLTDLLGAALTAIQEQQAILDQGRVAMWVNSTFSVDFGSEEDNGERTGAVPLPVATGENQGSGFSSATGYFISAETESRQACWEWIKFLTEQSGLGNGLPARQEVAEADAYRQNVGPELADAYLASIRGATQAPWSQAITNESSWLNYPFIWLYGAYDKIIQGELEVEEALENAQQMGDDYRACVIAADAFDDDAAQKACMMEIDETLPAVIFGG
jgi:multiple sugar transport system substrate-binding protein